MAPGDRQAPGGVFCFGKPGPAFSLRTKASDLGSSSPTGGDGISTTRAPEIRVNERIRVPQVRVIGDDGSQVGVLTVREALAMAQAKNLDLVEVSPTARPPVCRIMDFGKFKYEQSRKARKAKKKQHVTHLKEIKMRPKIEEHDYSFKMEHARQFLNARDKVKFTIMFRGREMAHQDIGHRLVARIVKELGDLATVEIPARSEGRTLTMVVMSKPPKTPGPGPRPDGKDAGSAVDAQ